MKNFDGVRADAVDNVNADLLQIEPDFKVKYGFDQSQDQAIKHMSILEAWSHTTHTTMKTLQVFHHGFNLALSIGIFTLRPIGNRSGVEPLISNSMNDRSERVKTSKRMANYAFVRAQ